MPAVSNVFEGPVFVVQDNIDTDQIIPAQYLNLVPTIPEEYEKLGNYAMIGLPEPLYPERYVDEGELDSSYPIVVAGRNFGCGSSREHAPQSLRRAGFRAIVAGNFAEIFFGNATNMVEIPFQPFYLLIAFSAAFHAIVVLIEAFQICIGQEITPLVVDDTSGDES